MPAVTAFDIFDANGGFSLLSLTDAINKAPHKPRRIAELGLFEESGAPTTKIAVEERDGVLYLVPSLPRGAPPNVNTRNRRKLRELNTVHLPIHDRIYADSIQNIREFGSDTMLTTMQTKTNEFLESMRGSLEATIEYQRLGAIKGVVLDADGVTELADMFSLFEVTQEAEVDFALDAGSPVPGEVRGKCSGIIRKIEDALGDLPYDGIHAFVGPAFMDAIVDHSECRDAWQRWNQGEQMRAQVARRTFFFAGITFEEYRGKVGSIDYIGTDAAHFFPTGAPKLFRTVYAPAGYNDTVNTPGLPLYAKAVRDTADRWVDIYAESNPVSFCTRPKALMKGKRT